MLTSLKLFAFFTLIKFFGEFFVNFQLHFHKFVFLIKSSTIIQKRSRSTINKPESVNLRIEIKFHLLLVYISMILFRFTFSVFCGVLSWSQWVLSIQKIIIIARSINQFINFNDTAIFKKSFPTFGYSYFTLSLIA